ncbi:MAG: acyl-CoA desaturase [Myxococcales bacterium]|nr:acyl-CoA desaturase [Myxococcales bacterium]
MTYYGICAGIFLAAYAVNSIYISVLYHRGLTHGAVVFGDRFRRFVVSTGPWVVGIDPLTWCVMHRLHHKHSDTPADPHSPANSSIVRVIVEQLRSYERIMRGLIAKKKFREIESGDLNFPVHWLYRRKLWWLPYTIHLLLAAAVSASVGGWLAGGLFYLGSVTHPIQGWMVNAFGHSKGYRTFDNGDSSTNNLVVAMLVAGEGFQNNHHRNPRSAKFSYLWFEIDTGYALCKLLQLFGLLSIDREYLSSLQGADGDLPFTKPTQ